MAPLPGAPEDYVVAVPVQGPISMREQGYRAGYADAQTDYEANRAEIERLRTLLADVAERLVNLDAIKEKWLNVCGACDAGIGECNHPTEDYRPVMLELVREVERVRTIAERRVKLVITGAAS